jgi:hypothetical protein
MAEITPKSIKKMQNETKKAMKAVQHLELDLQEVKKVLNNIDGELSHTGGTGASRELSHSDGGPDCELSHTGGVP